MILAGAAAEVCDLTQTIDLLLALRVDAFKEGNWEGWNALRRTLQHVQSTSRSTYRKKVVLRNRTILPLVRPKKPSQMAREIMAGILRDSLTSRASEAYR